MASINLIHLKSNLLNEIFNRGHKIGVHPGYDTNNPDFLKKLLMNLKSFK